MWDKNTIKAEIPGQTYKIEQQYTIPRPTASQKTTTVTANNFDTMVFKMEVDAYNRFKSQQGYG